MKLPMLFRKLMPISIAIFVGWNLLLFVVPVIGIFIPSVMDKISDPMGIAYAILWAVFFSAMMVSMFAPTWVRFIENAALRGLGQSGVATIVDLRTLKASGKYLTYVDAVRVKLNVRTAEGETFEAVAEDSGNDWYKGDDELQIGQQVPVKYDPLTHEVALVKPQNKRKEPKVKKPDW